MEHWTSCSYHPTPIIERYKERTGDQEGIVTRIVCFVWSTMLIMKEGEKDPLVNIKNLCLIPWVDVLPKDSKTYFRARERDLEMAGLRERVARQQPIPHHTLASSSEIKETQWNELPWPTCLHFTWDKYSSKRDLGARNLDVSHGCQELKR